MNNRPWRKTFFKVFLLVGLAVLAAWLYFLYAPLITQDQGYKYNVARGASFRSVSDDLYAKGVVTQRFFFNLLIRLRHDGRELKAGQYLFPKGTTPNAMLDQMASGTGILYHAFTIVPGWNFKQLSDALQQEAYLNHKLPTFTDAELMAHLGYPNINPEGQFLPETYFFVEGSSDTAILKRALKAMQEKLAVEWEQRAPNLPFKTPYEVLIAASLVEKEVYLATERATIAGVLVNRLRNNMLLQFDPTVIYGLGSSYTGTIHKEDLLLDTPYNTYLHKGLPPTPIAMPSLNTIKAVTHPEQNTYLYFVARRAGGAHQFSTTLNEHHAAVLDAEKRSAPFFNVELVQRYLERVAIKAALS